MKWNVKEVAEARGITNARQLGKLAEVPPMSMYQIWDGTAKRVDLATLNKLCNVLRVPLALLLEHTPDNVEPLPGSGSAQSATAKQAGVSKSERTKRKRGARTSASSRGVSR